MYSRNIIFTADDLAATVKEFLAADAFAFDVEAQGIYRGAPTRADVSWLAMATYGKCVIVPLGHPIGDKIVRYDLDPRMCADGKVRKYKVPVWEEPPRQLRWSEAAPILEPLFMSDLVKIGHNVPYDAIAVTKYFGQPPKGPYRDTIVTQWLLDENLKLKGLKDRVKKTYGADYDKENVGKKVETFPFRTVARYGYQDAKYTWLLDRRLVPQISRHNLDGIFALENEIIEVVIDMGLEGVPVDEKFLLELEEKFGARLVELEAEIYRSAGMKFNLNAPKQKANVLYGSKNKGFQGLKVHKLTPNGEPSTDAEALKPHADNPVVKAMAHFAVVDKLQGTYVKPWLGHSEKDPDAPALIMDGRIHASLLQYGTDTGRFSSRNPNLQNIPARTEEGKLIRQAFAAPDGWSWLVADYDQIELRILAHYAGEGRLRDAFLNGEDPHAATAAALFGVDISQVTPQQRGAGKGGNFSCIYGTGPETMAAAYNLPVPLCKKFLENHPTYFPEIYDFKDRVWKACRSRKPPHVRTLFGRYRRLPEINWSSRELRSRAERQAVNSIIQGTNADITKIAMVEIRRRARKALPDLRLALTVHDEVGCLVPDEYAEEGAAIIREAMLGDHIQRHLKIPLTADVKLVHKWSEAK